jgi:PAS domain S-box-containing protein
MASKTRSKKESSAVKTPERKNAEEKLKASESRYRRLFEAAKDGILILDADSGQIVDVNPFLRNLLGYTIRELLGKRLWEIGTFKDIVASKAAYRKLLNKEYVRYENLPLETKDGRPVKVEFVSNVYLVDEKKVIQCNIRDITERKRIEEALRESEERYRDLFENAEIGMYRTKLDGSAVLAANNKLAEIIGLPKEEILSSPTFIHWENPGDREEMVRQLTQKGSILDYEIRLIDKNGEVKTCLCSGKVFKEQGVFEGSLVDVTDRKRAEEKVKEAKERLSHFVNSAVDQIYQFDSEMNLIEANPPALKMLGRKREDAIGRHALELSPNLKKTGRYGQYLEVIRTGKPFLAEDVIPLAPFKKMYLTVRSFKAGNGLGIIVTDITERKRAEEKTARHQTTVNAINAIFKKSLTRESEEDLAETCLEVAQELVGAKFGFFGEVNSEGKFDTLAISSPGWSECNMPESQAASVIKGMEIRGMQFLPLKDGESRIFNEPSSHPDSVGIPEGHPTITNLLAVPLKQSSKVIGQIGLGNKEGGFDAHDKEAIEALSAAIVETMMRNRTETALEKAKATLHTAMNQSQAGIAIADAEGQIEYINNAGIEIGGEEKDKLAVSINEYVSSWKRYHLDGRPLKHDEFPLAKAIMYGETNSLELLVKRADKDIVVWTNAAPILDSSGNLTGAVAVFLDVTERMKAEKRIKEYSERLEEMVGQRTKELREAQQELLLKERLAVLGQFSGSISHELRNPLAVIDSSAYVLVMKLKDADEKVRTHLERIRASVENATNSIQSLLSLTHMKKPALNKYDLVSITSDSIENTNIPREVKVVDDFPENEVYVDADREQLRMALKNIVKNAVDAMQGEGTLSVAIRRTKNGQAELLLGDTGPGIPKENLNRIFQPLFSTKANGIGFGLSIAKMVVENHEGTIQAHSNPGKGTVFTVRLPLSAGNREE